MLSRLCLQPGPFGFRLSSSPSLRSARSNQTSQVASPCGWRLAFGFHRKLGTQTCSMRFSCQRALTVRTSRTLRTEWPKTLRRIDASLRLCAAFADKRRPGLAFPRLSTSRRMLRAIQGLVPLSSGPLTQVAWTLPSTNQRAP